MKKIIASCDTCFIVIFLVNWLLVSRRRENVQNQIPYEDQVNRFKRSKSISRRSRWDSPNQNEGCRLHLFIKNI